MATGQGYAEEVYQIAGGVKARRGMFIWQTTLSRSQKKGEGATH